MIRSLGSFFKPGGLLALAAFFFFLKTSKKSDFRGKFLISFRILINTPKAKKKKI
jgi:hypothetical protein